MDEFNQNVAHISCPKCNRKWQVLNEDGTDWDEVATASQYYADISVCQTCNASSNSENT